MGCQADWFRMVQPIFSGSTAHPYVDLPKPAVRPHTGRYVPIRQLTSTQTARYRVVLPKSTVGSRLREKYEKGEEEEGEEEEKHTFTSSPHRQSPAGFVG
ncbi:hypothetical protein GW17_00055865 [Ensete ventricosum]|nr:hypothetical protein GW17_00055865 [Ensete ventricosum]